MIHAARFETMTGLLAFHPENCCQGALASCSPAAVCKPEGVVLERLHVHVAVNDCSIHRFRFRAVRSGAVRHEDGLDAAKQAQKYRPRVMPSLAQCSVAECLVTAFRLRASSAPASWPQNSRAVTARWRFSEHVPDRRYSHGADPDVRPGVGRALQSRRQHSNGLAPRIIGKYGGRLHRRASDWCDCWRARRARDV